jgi:hypothetical protein
MSLDYTCPGIIDGLGLPKGEVLKVWENPYLVNPSFSDNFLKVAPKIQN